MAYILKTDGSIINNCGTELEDLQSAVGGHIEIVPTKNGKYMVVNEEGKLMGLEVNVDATKMYESGGADFIVGNVVICEKNEIK